MAETSDTEQLEQQLSAELLKIHCESYGRGAGDSRVYIHDDLVIYMLDDIELLPNEEFLINSGEGQGVIDVRSRYQQAIETTFRAAVERVTGRRVTSFASTTKLDPNYVVEIFRLAKPQTAFPPPEPGNG